MALALSTSRGMDLVPTEPDRYLTPLVIKEAHPSSPDAMRALKSLEVALSVRGGTMVIADMTSHHFCEGIYARQWNQAAGVVVISKIHARENLLVLLAGECLIHSGDEVTHLKAPHVIKTMPGVKRAVYAITDTTIMTFHANPDNERDLEKLEARYIIPELPWQEAAKESL